MRIEILCGLLAFMFLMVVIRTPPDIPELRGMVYGAGCDRTRLRDP